MAKAKRDRSALDHGSRLERPAISLERHAGAARSSQPVGICVRWRRHGGWLRRGARRLDGDREQPPKRLGDACSCLAHLARHIAVFEKTERRLVAGAPFLQTSGCLSPGRNLSRSDRRQGSHTGPHTSVPKVDLAASVAAAARLFTVSLRCADIPSQRLEIIGPRSFLTGRL